MGGFVIPPALPFSDALEVLSTALAVGLVAALLAAFTQIRR